MTVRSIASAATALVLVAASSAAQEPKASVQPAWRAVQGFNIVLVVGEMETSGRSSGELPSGAKKALDDMREFLPYKHYRVLDSQWISCCSTHMRSIAGRLQGVVDVAGREGTISLVSRPYAFTLRVTEARADIPVRFILQLEGSVHTTGKGGVAVLPSRKIDVEEADLEAELATLSVQIREMQGRVEVGVASPLELRTLTDQRGRIERRLAARHELRESLDEPNLSGTRPVIDSSFTMDPGETVVVGTSGMRGGGKALIALVTAVPQRGTTTRR
jgi:hypothetical protein